MITTLLIVGTIAIATGAAVIDYRTYSSLFRSAIILVSGALLIGFVLESTDMDGDTGPVILLTDGVHESDLPPAAGSTIISLESIGRANSEDLQWLASIDMLPDVVESGRLIEVYGNGSNRTFPEGYRWVNRLREPGDGILIDEAPHQVDTGTEFRISGRLITKADADSITLYRDGGRIETLPVETDGSFSFQDRLWIEGPGLYHLEAQGADTLLREPWHIRASEPASLSVAVMLYSPLFEITHLAEWLGNSGHHLAMRTRVGKDRFRLDEINEPPSSATNLTDNLQAFDLLILDPREVSEFSPELVFSIRRAAENGLDILVLPPSENGESEWHQVMESFSGEEIGLDPVSRIEERQWTPDILEPGSTLDARIPLINFNYAVNVSNANYRFSKSDAVPIVFYEESVPVAIRLPAAQGSVSSHLFYQTYRWKLRGDMELYTRFWSDYIDRVITLEAPFVEFGPMVPSINGPMVMTTSGSELEVRNLAQGRNHRIPLLSGDHHPGVSYGTFWPRSAGWHLAESDGTDRWFYVYDQAWSFNDSYRRYDQTKREIETAPDVTADDRQPDNAWLPNWAWLIGFLLLQTVLWIERKLGS